MSKYFVPCTIRKLPGDDHMVQEEIKFFDEKRGELRKLIKEGELDGNSNVTFHHDGFVGPLPYFIEKVECCVYRFKLEVL